jgi:hypothetical protein
MTNRVVMGNLPGGSSGLRVSRPGYDVLTHPVEPRGLAFDSGWTSALKVFMSGSVSVPSTTSAFQYVTVGFGTTFSAPPICLVWCTNPTGTYAWANSNNFMDQTMVGFSGWTNESVYSACKISTSSMRFLRFSTDTNYGAYVARYVVLVDQ